MPGCSRSISRRVLQCRRNRARGSTSGVCDVVAGSFVESRGEPRQENVTSREEVGNAAWRRACGRARVQERCSIRPWLLIDKQFPPGASSAFPPPSSLRIFPPAIESNWQLGAIPTCGDVAVDPPEAAYHEPQLTRSLSQPEGPPRSFDLPEGLRRPDARIAQVPGLQQADEMAAEGAGWIEPGV